MLGRLGEAQSFSLIYQWWKGNIMCERERERERAFSAFWVAPGFLLGMKRMASVLFICVFGVSSLLTLKIFPATPFCGFLYEEDFTRASTKTKGMVLQKCANWIRRDESWSFIVIQFSLVWGWKALSGHSHRTQLYKQSTYSVYLPERKGFFFLVSASSWKIYSLCSTLFCLSS